ncbi:MAG TPA: protein-L-isoaspartate(D-aspartate) O-methyltransferase [Ignavibacteria bacterium]|nr:protein-L-isoaspartate(D-aspartate) O-methyltransferase [Ignavibacteria bacterium]HMQ98921.1 protein-L-isoaspartate(D-aspartate) O-methyltransferase [Ignavibacteria bacterium]
MLLLEEEKRKLVEGLWDKGIKDESVLKAIYDIPREKFISDALRKFAYDDNALPIECAQTISQPFTVAYMTQVLAIKHGDKILEIGTGSGYQAAVLCKLGAEVYSVERIEKLYENASGLLRQLGYNVHLKLDDGTLGWEENAPYDKIIVTAGAPDIPHHLVEQLNIGGKLVIPVGDQQTQRLLEITRTEKGVEKKFYEHFKFVPLIGAEGWKA